MQSKLSYANCTARSHRSLQSHTTPAIQAARSTSVETKQLNIAVVGAGLAGCASVWHLLNLSSHRHPVQVHLFDAEGIAAGGSGAAAGLLHAYSSTGKMLWRGEEAMRDAVQLVMVAEQHSRCGKSDTVDQHPEPSQHPWVWQHGLVRPASNAKQVLAFRKALSKQGSKPADQDAASATMPGPQPLTAGQLEQLVPGITVPSTSEVVSQKASEQDQQQAGKLSRRQRRQQIQKEQALQDGYSQQEQDTLAGLLVKDGLVLHPPSYLQALWQACKERAQQADNGSGVYLHTHWTVRSLEQLTAPPSDTDGQPDTLRSLDTSSQADWVRSWDAIVVAAGAAVGTIKELKDVVPVQLCQGYTLHMVPEDGPAPSAAPRGHAQYPPGAPSLLGSTYLAAHGQHKLVIGATRAFGLGPEESLALCQPSQHWLDIGVPSSDSQHLGGDAAKAQQEGSPADTQLQDLEVSAPGSSALLQDAAQLWPPVGSWRVSRVRSGVRALPPRTPAGSIPLLGCLPLHPTAAPLSEAHEASLNGCPGPRVWVVGGLGARGLLYHAMLARLLASAILSDDASLLPAECRFDV